MYICLGAAKHGRSEGTTTEVGCRKMSGEGVGREREEGGNAHVTVHIAYVM